MSSAASPTAAACPGCIAVAPMDAAAIAMAGGETVHLSLPTIHCAGCISTIERGLTAVQGVDDVRVNLTRKRATMRVQPGVDIIAAVARLGFEAQILDSATLSAGSSDRMAQELAMRLGVAGFAMMNVMLLSVAVWAGATDATRDMFHWISAAIALPAIGFAAQPFFRNALAALSVGRLNMDVPISLALILATGMSLFETMSHGQDAYFDAALSLTFFLLAGRYLDQRMRGVARSAASELAALETPTALRMVNGQPQTVRLTDVAVGDILLVQPGARVPVDGTVTQGASELDRAFLTGESDPVAIASGGIVRAGEVNLTGVLHVTATAVGPDTVLHGLADMVAVAETAKSRYNSLADRAARIYAPLVHLLALAAFVLWLWLTGGDIRVAMNIAVAVLIITCPCALGLAVPAVSTVASGRLFKRGLLVKHATALERLAEVDAVVFDKTGTLTLGTPALIGQPPREMLALAGALAQGSGHPRSKAIVAGVAGMDLPEVTEITEEPGMGVRGIWQGREVRLGRAVWVVGEELPDTCVAIVGEKPVTFQFEDKLRPGATELVAGLQEANIPVTLLSGDTKANVAILAAQLGIPDWRAQVLPNEKADHMTACRDAGQRVLMVGDGLNDVGALALAHVSIAPASALEATRVAADVVLVSPDLGRIADALKIGRSARRRILENFAVAAAYNAVAVPIAFLGFASPLAAAIAMSSSSIIVSLNALRVR